jgi:Bacterial SH3 domain
MRRMAWVLTSAVLLSGPALGAASDVLVVTGDRVNVRSGPGTDREVVRQVSRNQRLVEIGRQGDWVHVELGDAAGPEGWIHGSLVAPADAEARLAPAASPPPSEAMTGAPVPAEPTQDLSDVSPAAPGPLEMAAAPPSEPQALAPGAAAEVAPVDLQRFRDSVAYLNSRAQALAGVDLFGAVEPRGGGVIRVGATDGWASIPPAAQRSYASALLERWAAATGRAGQLSVQIVDDSGRVIMEESKP